MHFEVPHGFTGDAADFPASPHACPGARSPVREAARLSRLHAMGIMDSPPSAAFDAIASAAAAVANTPAAMVSLLDEHRQWFMARSGIDTVETPRAISFCTHTIEGCEPFIVEDAQHDARFADNPLVTAAPYVRFYAGFPLDVGAGLRVGTLCVIDNRPRKLTAAQIDSLLELAHTTVQWLLALAPRGGPR